MYFKFVNCKFVIFPTTQSLISLIIIKKAELLLVRVLSLYKRKATDNYGYHTKVGYGRGRSLMFRFNIMTYYHCVTWTMDEMYLSIQQ